MPSKNATLGTAVSDEIKAAFVARAEATDRKPGLLLHDLVVKFLELEPPPAAPPPERGGPRTGQVFVRLSPYHFEDLRIRSEARIWTRAVYLQRLYCMHADKRPQFCQAEVAALLQAARQLADLGRNVNQVARVLNAAPEQAWRVLALDLEAMRERVDATGSAVKALVRAHFEELEVGDVE
jgi:hypothetical protein